MSEHTSARLARALSEIPGMPREMIALAVDGHYDDYLSTLAFPLMQLVIDLSDLARLPTTGPRARAALAALVDRVKNGEFDATKEEADAWAASPEGQEAFRELMGRERP